MRRCWCIGLEKGNDARDYHPCVESRGWSEQTHLLLFADCVCSSLHISYFSSFWLDRVSSRIVLDLENLWCGYVARSCSEACEIVCGSILSSHLNVGRTRDCIGRVLIIERNHVN